MTFLQRVAAELWERHATSISEQIIVFPNKRAGQWFKSELAKISDLDFQAPACLSIEEFIENKSSYTIAGNLDLLLNLFQIYKKYVPEEDFEKFYKWGNLILSDFDEIDKYLIHTERLFRNLSAIKELESDEMPEPLQKEFWESVGSGINTMSERFIALWEIYRLTYYEFKKSLALRKSAYPGMCYREVAELFQSGKIAFNESKIVFVGLNALSRSEEIIIASLLETGSAEIFWDMDEYYISNPREESGNFIRRALKNLPTHNTLPPTDYLLKQKKRINIIGVPLQIGQAKSFGIEFRENIIKDKTSSKAIVLPDENLLLPVLHSLPKEVETLNITSGYPLKHTSLYSFLEIIFSLHNNYFPKLNSYYYKDVIQILNHPFITCTKDEDLIHYVNEIGKQNQIYILTNSLSFKSCLIANKIFKYTSHTKDFIQYLIEIINEILITVVEAKEDSLFTAEFIDLLSDLQSIVNPRINEISINVFIKLLKEDIGNKRINITKQEDNASLQVMGLLETRCLNFDTLFFLSVNEGILPANQKSHSYIPYDLRKAFGLPTSDEQDALFSYYFYRLIQGANEIFLFYNAETGSKGEEKSRYIRQIEQYLSKENNRIELIYKNFTLPIVTYASQTILIKKDDNFFNFINAKNEKTGISPSLLSGYYTCPLQFLLKSSIELSPLNEVTEEWEAGEFGDFFHKLMELIYYDMDNEMIYPEFLKEKKSQVHDLLQVVLANNIKSSSEYNQNRNSLMIDTLKILADKTLDADIQYAPFRLIALELEQKVNLTTNNYDFPTINLVGKIDRIDEKDGNFRIVDYKTGIVDKLSFNYRDNEKLAKENKEAFQTLFYSYIFLRRNESIQDINPVIMPLRKVAEGYKQVNSGILFNREEMKEFEIVLTELIQNVLNSEEPIRQTEEMLTCAYCDYRHICLR
jgi:hypothetical protein